MSIVLPPTSFRARAHPLGAQIVLKWSLPQPTPAAYALFLLKKQGSDITPAEFSDFVGNTGHPWAFEVHEFAKGTVRYSDLDVVNGTTYYYRLTLRDDTMSPPQYSNPFGEEIPASPPQSPPAMTEPAGAHATPRFNASLSFPDAKGLLLKALERVQANRVGMASPELPIAAATLYPHQAIQQMNFPAISVVRANQYFDAARVAAVELKAFDIFSYNSVFREFMGNQLGTTEPLTSLSANTQTGLIEQDNLLVVWRTTNAEDRDSISTSMRGARAEILNYLHENGVMEIRTAMGSDFVMEDTQTLYGCSYMVQCRFESKFQWLSDVYVGDPVNEVTYTPPYGEPPYQTTLNQDVQS